MKSEEFEMKNGVKQGDSLSPLQFIILFDEIIKTRKRRTAKLKVCVFQCQPTALLRASGSTQGG